MIATGGLLQRWWCNGALLQPCTPCLFCLFVHPIPPLLPCIYAAASGLYDHVLPNFSSKLNQKSINMAKCRVKRYGQIEPAQGIWHKVFHRDCLVPPFTMFFNSIWNLVCTKCWARRNYQYSILGFNSAAEDSIQGEYAFWFCFGKFILVDCENVTDGRGEKVLVMIIPFSLTRLR